VGLFLAATVWAIFDDTALFWWPFFAVGCLLLIRADWHPMGWLMVAIAFALWLSLGGVPGTEHLPDDAAPWTLVFALFAFVTLVFPSGRLSRGSDRWSRITRWLAFALVVFAVVEATLVLITIVRGQIPTGPLVRAVAETGYVGTLLILLVGAVSLVFRWRRSTGELRAQLAWVVAALTLIMASLILAELAAVFITEVLGMPPVGDDIYIGVSFAFFTVPIAITVAIFRYHLYDLGRLVRRTVSYAVLVVVLAAVYALGILGLGSLIGRGSPLVVAGSTLAAAALFNPVRRQVQQWVDRRFDRQRYDAQRLVDEFNARLRDHVDLDGLIPDLTGVVGATLRPASMSVWVREEAGS